MKLTHERLKQIIKEELEEMMSEKPKTVEDVVFGTYQGREYAADEDKANPNNFELFKPVAPFEPVGLVIPKNQFETDWYKTEIERIKAKPPMPAAKPRQKKEKFYI